MKNNNFVKDLLAGLTVSFAAISLGAAFGTMSGRGALAGMIGAGVIPIITSLLGGTRIQASGPTAPMTAITALLVAKAYDQFPDKTLAEQFITLTILLSGLFLTIGGVLKLGRFIKLVPNVIVLGFMNGIAVLIWVDQLKKIFGFKLNLPFQGHFIINILCVALTLTLIFTLPLFFKKIIKNEKIRTLFSALLISIFLVTLISNFMNFDIEKVNLGASVDSFNQYLQSLINYFPSMDILKLEYLYLALPLALQLMILGYFDSLLTAIVIDKLTGEKTQQNKELIAQGVANSVSGFFQGIPGAQATIRSVLLIKENAQTRFAGVLIGFFVIICLIFFKSWIGLIPAAVFAGVLIKAGWDVLDKEFIKQYITKKWYNNSIRNFQISLIIYTTLATVIINLNFAIISGSLIFYISKWLKLKSFKDVESKFEDNLD